MAQNDIRSLPAASAGLTFTTSTTLWQFTSWASAGTVSSDIYITHLIIQVTSKPVNDQTAEILVEIGVGGTGSEVTKIQIPYTARRDTAVGYRFDAPITFYLPEPFTVPSGSQVSVRVANNGGVSASFDGVKIVYIEGVSSQTLTVPLLSDGDTLHQPTISPQAVAITVPILSDADTLYEPTITQVGASQDLTVPLFTNSIVLYDPVVTPQSVNLSVPLLTNESSLFSPSLVQQQSISLSLLTNDSTDFPPIITVGSVDISLPNIDNSTILFSPSISPQAIELQMPLIDSVNVFYEPTVSTGSVVVEVGLLDNLNELFPMAIEGVAPLGLYLPIIDASSFIYDPIITNSNPEPVPSDNYLTDGYSVKENRLLRLKADDEEVITFIKVFLQCQG